MTRTEFSILVKGMKAVYSDPKFIADKDAFDVWYGLLQDLDYKNASMALKKYMQSCKFPPTIADIREQYTEITTTQELNGMEAWSLVSKALRNGYYGAEAEFNKLPAPVKRAVGHPSNLRQWAQTDVKSVENVIQSNFLRSYESVMSQGASNSVLDRGLRQLMSAKENPLWLEENNKQDMIETKEGNNSVPMPKWAKDKMNEIGQGGWK